MASSIKRSAIPASGYDYQMLVGLRMLGDWLDTPTLYRWVQFEADTEEGARGLDDIVYQRADSLKGLVQVKFTVDPFNPDHALSWKWLTLRTKKGRSLLQKWSTAAFGVGLEHAGEVRLITNRRPDVQFAEHLRGCKVDFTTLPEPLRTEIAGHIGSEADAQRFFERFEFDHSFAGHINLERSVSADFESRHTDHAGWLELQRRAFEWTVYKDSPKPDGRITLELLRATISERQPRPLDQEFRIPAGYVPPDEEFGRQFIEEAEAGKWDLRALWGSPGQGKSTFVSFLCEQLRKRELPFARHHYFLDLQDSSDRFTLKRVARSLIAQMREEADEELVTPADDEDLRGWIRATAEAYAAKGKRFFVLVDGLDHIWRENDEEIAPMEALFAQLLPLPPNATLILGTQRVDERQLPARLNRYLALQHWIELPRMRLSAVRKWLQVQHEAGTFQLPGEASITEEISELATAFQHISEGHPLVLTYSFLQLSRTLSVLTPSVVRDSTPTPVGDSRVYYQGLWQRLSWPARDALHLMAQDDLIWPADGLARCVQETQVHLELEVGHLIAPVDAGLVAFHGSLYVFVRAQSDHARRLQALVPKVEAWLEHEAAPYLRWAWLWLYQARRADHAALLAGTTRGWVLNALVRAYPAGQIVRILAAAEDAAFEAGDYEQALRKRAVKTRLQNGLTYQLDEADVLENIALQLTSDPFPALLLASQASQSSVAGLRQLAMLYLSLGQVQRARAVQERMRGKINDRVQVSGLRGDDYQEFIEQLLEVAAGTGDYKPERVIFLLRRHARGEEVFAKFLNGASRATDPAPHIAFCSVPMPVRLRRVLEVEAVRTAAWCGANLHEWAQFRHFRKHPLSVCWRLLYQSGDDAARAHVPVLTPGNLLKGQIPSYDGDDLAQFIHFAFFRQVARELQLGGAADPRTAQVHAERQWLDSALRRVAAAAHACAALLTRGEAVAFSLIYSIVSLDVPALNDHTSWSDWKALRKAMALIAADLFLLVRPRSKLSYVPASEWERSRRSPCFAEHHLRELYLTRHYEILDGALVRVQIETEEAQLRGNILPFNEKASEFGDLCEWATAYGLHDLAERLLEATYCCAMGYGWRKDWRLPRVLEAVQEVSKHDRETGIWAIEALAPIYVSIDDMTEKSGASPSDLAAPLLDLMPQTFAGFYRELLDRAQWYEADRAFKAFTERVNLQDPSASPALAFLWDASARDAVAKRRGDNPTVVDALVRPWENGVPTAVSEADGPAPSPADPVSDKSAMPPFQDYAPAQIDAFLVAIEAAHQSYKLANSWAARWFEYWQTQGQQLALLEALARELEQGRLRRRGAHLLDLAYDLSLRLQGAKKAFWWLVQAHRHRYGWSENYHAHPESVARVAKMARNHKDRWAEFVALTSQALPEGYEPGRAIPDAALASLLVQVGQIQRAASMLRTMVQLVVEEFEVQPLARPQWLGPSA